VNGAGTTITSKRGSLRSSTRADGRGALRRRICALHRQVECARANSRGEAIGSNAVTLRFSVEGKVISLLPGESYGCCKIAAG